MYGKIGFHFLEINFKFCTAIKYILSYLLIKREGLLDGNGLVDAI
ncbi:hypothetical protein AsAng_0030790 [Aureispira anguillae]|uniref:Uncharacterized protein n=1 Tax=Aureispira anguillae TaxID=2864201 RepID=A0A915YFU6_9BACT|nr:hypothetical protein AsAng_0030790 [Aureispira anguillae]